ncbi:MAG: TonB family protein [Bryobacterales bacterium]|nr:TonB family protein [Bryobacterales bacterium]
MAPALAVALTALACGHQEEIALSGFVQDPSGSRVPHAHVLITDAEAGITEATTAGADGAFRIGGLAPSPSYRIEVRGPVGFEPHSQSLDLTTDQHLDVMLRVGPIVEAIVISGQRPQPESGQPPAQRRRIRVGGNVRKARLVHYVSPAYPAEAESEGVEGTVYMEAVVGTDGRLVGLSTLNSNVDQRLEAAASDAVLQWQYEPTLLNGRPVEVAVTLNVAFELP